MRAKWFWIKDNWKKLPHPLRWVVSASVGGTLVVLGLSGLVLPVIPGIPLLVAGLAMLATEFAWAETLLNRTKHHASRAAEKVRRKKK